MVFFVFLYFSIYEKYPNAHEGMSVIPENTDDIPLYKGLTPRDSDYVINGNKTKDIFDYYELNLEKNGWKTISSKYHEQYQGFEQDWEKEGEVLHLLSQYQEAEDETTVLFDKRNAPNELISSYQKVCMIKNEQEECLSEADASLLVEQINLGAKIGALPASTQKISEILIKPMNLKVNFYSRLEDGNKYYYAVSKDGVLEMKPDEDLNRILEN